MLDKYIYIFILKKELIKKCMKFKLNTNIENIHYFELIDINFIPTNKNILFKKFYENLKNEKDKIDKLENTNNWDKMKKIGNPYELIYTTYNKKRKNDSISLYIPISRAYFKLWEIYYNFSFFDIFEKKDCFVFSHLAEGPGGFLEASYNYRKKIEKNNTDKYYCITLKPTNDYIPDFNKLKKIFVDNPSINIEYGNLYVLDEIKNYIKKFDKNKAHIVTADGGFDYSGDFNGQEINSCQIIYSECIVALNILIKNGSFICKIFDIFSITMIQILYILSHCFEEVYVYKPETSRPANSEKYFVCLRYKDNLSKKEKKNLLDMIFEWNEFSEKIPKNISIVLDNIKIDNKFIQNINEFNENYIQSQIFYLNKIIHLSKNNIDKESYYDIIHNQVNNAIKWCQKYKIPINKNSLYYKKNTEKI